MIKEALSDMSKNWPFRMLLKTAHLAHQFEGTYIDETTLIPITKGEEELVHKIGSEAVKKQLPKGEMVDMKREYLA